VDHLVGLGHEKFAAITGLSSMETGRRRRQGLITALERAGLPCRPGYVVESDYSFAGGQAAFAKIWTLEDPPTALVVSEFAMGIGALLAARAAGVNVPGDLSIAVFNNLEIASYLAPTVTTVGLQLSALGAEGVELLVDRPPGEGINQTVSKPAELFIRDSTGRPPAVARRPHRTGSGHGAD
jgi:LacI family transcriptional regulator